MKFLFLLVVSILCMNCTNQNNEEREILFSAIDRNDQILETKVESFQKYFSTKYEEEPLKYQSSIETIEKVEKIFKDFNSASNLNLKRESITQLKKSLVQEVKDLDLQFLSADHTLDSISFEKVLKSDIINAKHKIYNSLYANTYNVF